MSMNLQIPWVIVSALCESQLLRVRANIESMLGEDRAGCTATNQGGMRVVQVVHHLSRGPVVLIHSFAEMAVN